MIKKIFDVLEVKASEEVGVALYRFSNSKDKSWKKRKIYTNKNNEQMVWIRNTCFKLIEEYGELKAIETTEGIATESQEAEVEQEQVEFKNPQHEEYETIKTLIKANIPVYLVGPAGSGKNFTLEAIAEELGLDFYFTNSVQQEFKITGFIDAGGNYHETEFYRAFTNGGLFFLDEMDASVPEVLVLLNAAIANGYFDFPKHGKVKAHKKFRVVAAGNTMGNGADEQYSGRLVLDQASLDRFAIIEFNYSPKIELHIAKGNVDLVHFIRGLRKDATSKGIRATFSYRCIAMVVKLESKMDLQKVLKIAVFKGLDVDTINNFYPTGYSKYDSALKMLQGA